MFFPHCHHIASFLDNPGTLEDSMRHAAAFIVERDLQESRRQEAEKSGNNFPEHSTVKPLPFRF